jgi:hypothetical protein
MPTNLEDASTGSDDLYFADDLSGIEFKLREAAVYDADEVSDDGEVPEFGRWLPATVDDRDCWLVAVGELVSELQRYEDTVGVTFAITRCEKSGTRQTDPYEVNVEQAGDTGQSRL